MFAVVKIGGRQYKVSESDELKVEKLKLPKTYKEGTTFEISEVLLIKNKDAKSAPRIGNPHLKEKVKAKVLSAEKGKKVDVLKYKPKKGYRKKIGYRQSLTKIKILKIG